MATSQKSFTQQLKKYYKAATNLQRRHTKVLSTCSMKSPGSVKCFQRTPSTAW